VELARQYGATDIVDYKQGDATEQMMTLTGGQPVDNVLVASGGSASEQSPALHRWTVECPSGLSHTDAICIRSSAD
jgi:NADPH:quinone reductase-like Zn-dependent oxidoreductase